jgi:hypothetical protein
MIQANDILLLNYWEHFKLAKDLALIYPPEHLKRKLLEEVCTDLLNKINH